MKPLLPTRAPLLPVAVALASGIVVRVPPSAHVALTVVLAVMVAVGWMSGRRPLLQGLALLGTSFVGGMLLSPGPQRLLPHDTWLDAVVVAPPAEKPRTVAVEVTAPAYDDTRRLYLIKDERSLRLRQGAALRFRLGDKPYVRPAEWQEGGDAARHLSRLQRARMTCLAWRERLLNRYRRLDGGDDQYAVLAAMTLGSKSALTPRLRDVYSQTGASHVLALSGLHLGIIYLLLSRLLTFRRRWAEALVVVPALWAFAFVTGLSPSVVRSALMLSIFALFAGRGQRWPSVNVLCFTAIVMLLVDARSLFDIGFQLSFAAVGAILLFMPLLERLRLARRARRHVLTRWLWDITAVSVAAQAGTAPLVAYYFGRFSTYFLLTNLVVLPAATLILYGALLALLSPWPVVGQALLGLVGLLNAALTVLSRLPLSSIDGLHPSTLQVGLSYGLLLTLYAALKKANGQ